MPATTSTATTSTTTPAQAAQAAYRTACRLHDAGLRGDSLRAVVQKAAELYPAAEPPRELLRNEDAVVRFGERAERVGVAVGKTTAAVLGVLVALVLLLVVGLRFLGRARALRNVLHLWPPVSVDSQVGGAEDLPHLPALFQSQLENMGAGVGGQNIQFVTPPAADVSDVKVAGTPLPAQFQFLDALLALIRPLAPRDRLVIKLTAHPAGRQGVGLTAALEGAKGLAVRAMTLWESEIGLDGFGDEEPVLTEKERYQILTGPLAGWVYFAVADLGQREVHLFGTREWRSYGFFVLGSRLRTTHRRRAESLLRAAIDADPANVAARLNLLFLEFQNRRSTKGIDHFCGLLQEVKALPDNRLRLWRTPHRPHYWYETSWYRTMYSLAAAYVHLLCLAANADDAHAYKPDPKQLDNEQRKCRSDGETLAMDLVGACWVTLSDLSDCYGRPPAPSRIRGDKRRDRYRQRSELVSFLHEMLPSAVLLLGNFLLLDDRAPSLDQVALGSNRRVVGDDGARFEEWRRRGDILAKLDPRRGPQQASPDIRDLLSVLDPVDFLPRRASYNLACIHSEVAQFQDRSSATARASREAALDELGKGLSAENAQWGREDPALWDVRTHPTTRARFAELLARALRDRSEWAILSDLPFLDVIDAARLWVAEERPSAEDPDGGRIKTIGALVNLPPASKAAIVEPPSGGQRWLDAEELDKWTSRARLIVHLTSRFGDAELAREMEAALHRIGVTTVDLLCAQEPWSLAAKIRAVDPAVDGQRWVLAPAAVHVWAGP